ncbi:MAG: MFS transporter [Dehalococcoidia bacterium]
MLLVAGAIGVGIVGDSMLYAVLPARFESFGIQLGMVGVILSANRFIRLVTNTLAARVYARFGLYWPFSLAMLGAVVPTASYALVYGFWPLLAARVLWGLSFSFLRLGGYLTVLEEGSPEVRGRLMGLLNSGMRGGSLVGVFIGGLLADVLGHPMTFTLFAIAVGLAAVTMLVEGYGHRRQVLPVPLFSLPEVVRTGAPQPTVKTFLWELLISRIPEFSRALRYRLLSVNVLRFGIAFSIDGLVLSTLAYLLGQLFGEGPQLGGVVLGVVTVTGSLLAIRYTSDLLLGPWFGHLSDRVGRWWVVFSALPLVAAALLVVGFAQQPLQLLLALPVLFVASTAMSVTLDAFAGDLAPPERRAQVMGRYATWLDLGSATGPLLGYGVGILIGFSWMYLASALLLLLAAGLYLFSLLRQWLSPGTMA